MYSSLVEWIADHYRLLSAITTLLVFAAFLVYGFFAKGLNFTSKKWDLGDLIMILTSSYSIFTGIVIAICCGQIEKLKSVQELWLFLIISGGALVYTCVYGIIKNINSKD